MSNQSNNISEAKRCEFCGTINDTHHSAQCIDTDKGATNRPISEDKNRDYTAEGYRIVSRRRRYKMSSFNKELDEITSELGNKYPADSSDVRYANGAIQDLFIKLVEGQPTWWDVDAEGQVPVLNKEALINSIKSGKE